MKNIKSYTQTLNEAEGQDALNKRLLAAAEKGKTNTVKDLLDRGAQVDARDKYADQTPLHLAAWYRHEDTIRLLLDKGAQIDAMDVYGHTPLYNAAFMGFSAYTARLLILNGADPFKAFEDPSEIIEFFNGDVDWWPEGELKVKLKRMAKGKSAFGM